MLSIDSESTSFAALQQIQPHTISHIQHICDTCGPMKVFSEEQVEFMKVDSVIISYVEKTLNPPVCKADLAYLSLSLFM